MTTEVEKLDLVALQTNPSKPWRDGDDRCRCSHCKYCGDIYPTYAGFDAHQNWCARRFKAVPALIDEVASLRAELATEQEGRKRAESQLFALQEESGLPRVLQSATPAEAPKLPTTRVYGGEAVAVEGEPFVPACPVLGCVYKVGHLGKCFESGDVIPATNEGAGRVTHTQAALALQRLSDEGSVYQDQIELLELYRQQQEAAEREAAGLMTSLRASVAKLTERTGDDIAEANVAELIKMVEVECDSEYEQRVAAESALTEAQAKLANSRALSEALGEEWRKAGVLSERDALKKQLQAQAEERAALLELESLARRSHPLTHQAALAKLDALRAKPAQQADQKPATPLSREEMEALCPALLGHASLERGYECLSCGFRPIADQKPAQAEQKDDALPQEMRDLGNPAGERGGFVSGRLRWHGGADLTICLVPWHRVQELNGPQAATAEDLEEFGWVPKADPAQPQPQGGGVTKLRADIVEALRSVGKHKEPDVYTGAEVIAIVARELEKRQP